MTLKESLGLSCSDGNGAFVFDTGSEKYFSSSWRTISGYGVVIVFTAI